MGGMVINLLSIRSVRYDRLVSKLARCANFAAWDLLRDE
jgi:hypothetical protein